MPSRSPDARLAIVLAHPLPHYSAWFRWLRSRTPLVFRVFYLDDSQVPAAGGAGLAGSLPDNIELAAGYDWELIENTARHPDPDRFFGLRNPSLHRRLSDWGPDAILVFGFSQAAQLRLLAWAVPRKIPVLLHSTTHAAGRPAPRGLKRVFASWVLRRFAAVLFPGGAAREFLLHHGVPPAKLFFAPHAVDTAVFDPSSPSHRNISLALRVELGLSADTRVVLFSGPLTPAQQTLPLLEAFIALDAPDTALVIVGDGPEKPDLLARAARAPEHLQLQFLPSASRRELPARYLLADLVVLPARHEPWGFAVNEAMQLGIPCLVSDAVGCQRDLVTDGETGWVFASAEFSELRQKLAAGLRSVSENPSPIRAAVADRIARYDFEKTSDGLLSALAFALDRKAPRQR